MPQIFALVDCNNFYASCEKLFRPDWANRPLVVLSNNDGCVVARSKEAKALGFKMGTPYFKVKQQIKAHNVVVCSSNYALYADLSNRVMQTLQALAPEVEIYSIDEAFLDLSDMRHIQSLQDYGRLIRATIQQSIGLTVCVGIAPTKTLAKAANHAAKHYPATGGVVDLRDPHRQRRLLGLLSSQDVWGVGRRLAARLHELGIDSALELADANPALIQRQLSVNVARTIQELNGEPCLSLEPPVTKQQIISSRSFGRRITDFESLRQAVCHHTARAAEKLRKENCSAKMVSVFIQTSLFGSDETKYSKTATKHLIEPTDDTRVLLRTATTILRAIWRDHYRYAKAGVILNDFYAPDSIQPDLFTPASNPSNTLNSQALMTLIDRINQSGKVRLGFASQGLAANAWTMQRHHLSPAYTTQWTDIPNVH